MKTRRVRFGRTISCWAASGLLVVGVAACGDDDEDATADSATTTEPSEPTSPATEPSGTTATDSDTDTAPAAPSTTEGSATGEATDEYAVNLAPNTGVFTTPTIDGSSVIVDVGNHQVTRPLDDPVRIAFFISGAAQQYGAAQVQGAEDAAAKYGVEVEVFDSNYDIATQDNQIETAINGGDFDAFMVMPNGPTNCELITEQAPSNNILVVVISTPQCDKARANNPDLWQEGLVAYIGGGVQTDAYRGYAHAIAEASPEGRAVLVTGPEGYPGADAITAALEEAADNSGGSFEVVGVARQPGFSAQDGLAGAQAMLSAHSDANVMVTNYTELSVGALQAIQEAGRELRIFDSGGSALAVEHVESGDFVFTQALYPYDLGFAGVEALVMASRGVEVPRVVLNDGHQVEPYTQFFEDQPYAVIDESALEAYAAQY